MFSSFESLAKIDSCLITKILVENYSLFSFLSQEWLTLISSSRFSLFEIFETKYREVEKMYVFIKLDIWQIFHFLF